MAMPAQPPPMHISATWPTAAPTACLVRMDLAASKAYELVARLGLQDWDHHPVAFANRARTRPPTKHHRARAAPGATRPHSGVTSAFLA